MRGKPPRLLPRRFSHRGGFGARGYPPRRSAITLPLDAAGIDAAKSAKIHDRRIPASVDPLAPVEVVDQTSSECCVRQVQAGITPLTLTPLTVTNNVSAASVTVGISLQRHFSSANDPTGTDVDRFPTTEGAHPAVIGR